MINYLLFTKLVADKENSGEWTKEQAMAIRNMLVTIGMPKCPPKLAKALSKQVNEAVGQEIVT